MTVAVMNGVVCPMRGRDEKPGVEDMHVSIQDVLDRDRIHVMNVNAIMNLVTRNTKITSIVACND